MKEKEYIKLKKKVDFKIYIFEEILIYLINNFSFDVNIKKKLQKICNDVEKKYILKFEGYTTEELEDYDIEDEFCEFTFVLSKDK